MIPDLEKSALAMEMINFPLVVNSTQCLEFRTFNYLDIDIFLYFFKNSSLSIKHQISFLLGLGTWAETKKNYYET